jgi:DNA-binding CsgD family transcriptional regulator/pimeloyl-ACP methyl ester carboxylesterase
MDAPPVQYVKTRDGYDIAYCETGSGTPFVFAGTGFCHVQLAWQMPGLAPWLEALASRFRLVQFDVRGTGMSTLGVPENFTLEHYQRDLEAVVDAMALDDFILYSGSFHIGCIVTQYAVEHPGRVKALIMASIGSALAFYRGAALYDILAEQDWDVFWQSLINLGSGAGDIKRAQRIVALYKQAYNQHDYILMARSAKAFDLASLLPRLKTPTLVIDARENGLLPRAEPMKVARLAQGRLVSVDGSSPQGDLDQGIRAIETFLADLPAAAKTLAADLSSLSAREIEVLRLLAQGKSNPEIAEQLFITRNTVQNHVSSILIKTNLNNRAQAAVYAKEHGIV